MYIPGYYEFYCRVKTVAGLDALEKIPGLLADMQASRPMVVTDKGVVEAGLIEILFEAIKPGVSIGAVADEVPPDSELRVVNRLAAVYRENGCDAILAVGGGSVIDTAKGINIVVSENAEDLMALAGAGALKKRLRPLIAVPTTAGTGSEVTLVAVIADHDRHIKIPFTAYALLPDAAVLDPRMTLTLPAAITAQTGMDALCHAVEAYTCLAKNPISDGAALSAMHLISRHLLQAVRQPDDRKGRLAMATAASLAGIAFSNSMVGMVHTLGHAVGGVCRVPHGTCMAIFLPYGLEYNMHRHGDYMADLLLPLAGEDVYARTPKHRRADEVVAWIRQLNQDLHEATGGRHARFLKEVVGRDGNAMVPKDRLEAVAATAINDGSMIYNPEELDYEDCLMVLAAAWEGRPLDRSLVKQG